ncbi:hypothetical protein [Actinophytocola sediminis]
MRAIASGHGTNTDHALEILRTMEIVADDRPTTFDAWLDTKPTGLAPAIARETGRWARHRHDGGPRSRPRSPNTAATYLRRVRPALVDWPTRYDHLREVTHNNVLACISGLRGEARRSTVTALRSLFRWARRNGITFRNPATGLRLGKRDYPVWQPLAPTDIAAAVAAATTQHARVFIALAAIHAARPGQIRALQLNDVDPASRRLRIAGHERPLDDLTHHVCASGWPTGHIAGRIRPTRTCCLAKSPRWVTVRSVTRSR